jgi:hypothetical protein
MDIEKKIRGLEKEQANIKRRLAILEDSHGLCGETGNKTIEFDLVLPQADIDGLHFNEQKVHAVFEEQDDGWWYSRDILFLSARNIKDDNSMDILTEYLNLHFHGGYGFIEQLEGCLGGHPRDIEVSLPKDYMSVKKYNGVDWWYWLADPYSGSAASFCDSGGDGGASCTTASSVGGCAPAFRVVL